MKIYTKSGDKGLTSLYGGKRLSKSDPHVEAYGSIDELTSLIGLVHCEDIVDDDKELLTQVQKDLYGLMSLLNYAPAVNVDFNKSIAQMEKRIDEIEEEKPTPNYFIIPQGTRTSALLHMCRTQTRKSERRLIGFTSSEKHKLKENDALSMIQYLNRLSDTFFALARFYNLNTSIKA